MQLKRLALVATLAACATVAATQAAGAQGPSLPRTHKAEPTSAAITDKDLMTRLYLFADDSMMGRTIGTPWNLKGTEYIAQEARRIGLKPAGDNGTYFQNVGVFLRALDPASTLTVNGTIYKAGTDFLATIPNNMKDQNTFDVVFGGAALDTVNVLSEDAVHEKLLVLLPPAHPPTNQQEAQALIASDGYKRYLAMVQAAGATASVGGATLIPAAVKNTFTPNGFGPLRIHLKSDKPSGPSLGLTSGLAEAILGGPVANATKGQAGKTVTLNLQYHDSTVPGRNVVAVLPGSDAKLNNEYVAIGAHNDHVPLRQQAVDHDSLRAFNTIARPGGIEDAPIEPSAEQWARINAMKDSLRALHGGMRLDSINNGADDDGSGSMGVLEIAEAFANAKVKPKRSLIFVWHTGEERGMYGSNYFTDNPTVPRDSIVAQLNVDMIGRGGAEDPVPWGGPSYLQLIGSKRLSSELGQIVEDVNTATNAGFKYDYQFDAAGDSHQYYCRSDHWAYARYGIPIAFFTTGGHRDYHMITDEPQYIDYTHYKRVTQLIHDIADRVANLDHRVAVDGTKGDPYGQCKQ